MISENNEDAYSMMIEKYKPLIRKYASYYYQKFKHQGAEKEELIQEGIVGLINAINSYMDKEICLFYTFVVIVIRREMERYAKRLTRNKNLILTNATSFYDLVGTHDLYIEDTLYNEYDTTERKISDNYYDLIIYNFKYELSDLQSQIYELRLNNFSNKEISKLLDITYKSVDNSIRLMKIKFKNYIQSKI